MRIRDENAMHRMHSKAETRLLREIRLKPFETKNASKVFLVFLESKP